MSEKSKVDTSSSSTSQIKNNPLLSASVTGMVLDDFPNKPLLLPAAPLIITKRPSPENLNNNKLSSAVTVGETPDIDSEQFSEINLNASSDDPVPFSLQSDINDNPFPQIQHEPPAHSPSEFADESILSQAASSFSQLPSVASTVFSTFSKVINNYTPTSQAVSRETSSERDLIHNTQQQHQQLGFEQYSERDLSASFPAPQIDTPKFFTPSDYVDHQKPSTPGPQLPPPLTVGTATGNTYRLTTKKKIYAQIPGLSKQLDINNSENNLVNQTVSLNSSIPYQSGYPPIQIQSQHTPVDTRFCAGDNLDTLSYTEAPQQLKTEDPPTRNNSTFSFSNIVPPVLQNITGFVKSTVTGSTEQPLQQPTTYQQQDQNQSSINFFDNSVSSNITAPSIGFACPENYNNSVNLLNSSEVNKSSVLPGHIGFDPIQTINNPASVQTSSPLKPPQLSGTSSFRLQKGTRLYKSPFEQNPKPSAPSIQAAFNLEPAASQPVQPVGIFNPQTTTNPVPPIVSGIPPLPSSEIGTNFFTPVDDTSSFIDCNRHLELAQVPLFNPLNNQQSIPVTYKNTQLYDPLNQQQNLPILIDNQRTKETQIFNPIDSQNKRDSTEKLPELTKFFNPINQLKPSEPIKDISLPIQSFVDQPELKSQTYKPLQEGSTLFEPQPISTLNFDPGQESQSTTNFFQNIPQPSTLIQEQFFDRVQNNIPNLTSIPNFPPPPIEKPEPKEDQYDSVPLQPPSVDQKPIIPLVQNNSELLGVQPIENPFRKSTGSNIKSTKTVTAPVPLISTIISAQLSENLSPTNFFETQTNQPDNNKDIIFANTINFATEQSFEKPQISEANIIPTDHLPIQKSDAIENLKLQHIFTKDQISIPQSQVITTQLPKETIKNTSNFSNFFGSESQSPNLNDFGNVNSQILTVPNTEVNFENQLINKIDNNSPIDQIRQSEQSDSVPDTTNFFTNNQIQINHPSLHLPTPSAEKKFEIIPEKTTEKLENKQQNLFTNFFTPIDQQQNIEKQTDFISTEKQSASPESNIVQKSDPLTFFDSFNNNTINKSSATNLNRIREDPNSQRIQNFFNNPPPQDFSDSTNNFSYNYYSGDNCQDIDNLKKDFLTTNYNTETNRPSTPASNLVEPPSSACSEFSSEYSLSGQQQLVEYLKKLSTDELPDEILEQINMSNSNSAQNQLIYQPAPHHWFFKKSIDSKKVWTPFSHKDSNEIEKRYHLGNPIIIPVEGGRYDVNILQKTRTPVYWNGDSTEVRRCSWFYKAIDSKYVPYDEITAALLESEYKNASRIGEWHKKIALDTGETVVFHGPTVIVHFLQSQIVDAWGGATQSQSRPRVVKRDLDDFIIEAGETNKVDHLLFMVHGIGSGCDLKFRSVEEVVEEFRSIAYQLVQSHYKHSCDLGEVGRVEVLPVSWHDELHSKESGIDEKLKAITLESIPRLRNFANDTVLDVLFYTSPVFCQNIINTVANCMNRVYLKYCERNTNFSGQISLAGHSLGSLILFDLLCHQNPIEDNDVQNSENPDLVPQSSNPVILPQISNQIVNTAEPFGAEKQVKYTMGSAGSGQPYINYPQLLFAPKKFFALGSPIGMFVTIRGLDSLGLDFKLPTCPGFYNIFHPYDPVAYRVEALINPELSAARPVLIPHHKGRKRMHLELKETMSRVGTEVKQRIVDTFKNTMENVFFLSPKNAKTDAQEIEEEVDKVLEMQIKLNEETTRIRSQSQSSNITVESENGDIDTQLGKLNDSKRIDYVLQEAPLEFFNEYIFALTSHVCYWESADTILFVVKEIYSSLGITTDSQIPQQTMTIERPNSADINT